MIIKTFFYFLGYQLIFQFCSFWLLSKLGNMVIQLKFYLLCMLSGPEEKVRRIVFLFVGGARALTLLSCSEQRFGTKSDVTPFIKPAFRSISFIIWAFPGVASNIPDTIQSNFTRFHILLYGLLKWSLIIHSSIHPCHIWLFVRGWVIMNIN